jgi:hypothetical protein
MRANKQELGATPPPPAAQISAGKSTQWRAARAKELQGVMAGANKAMKVERAVTVTDPQAQVISHYLAAAGWTAAPESVSMCYPRSWSRSTRLGASPWLLPMGGGGKAPLRKGHPSAVAVHRLVEAPDDKADDDDVAPPKGRRARASAGSVSA